MVFFCFLFFRQIFGFLFFFWDIWVLRDPTFSAKYIYIHISTIHTVVLTADVFSTFYKIYLRKRLDRGTLNTCAKFQGLTLKNGVDIWTFVRLSAKITALHRNYLGLVYIRFSALIFFWLNIGPTQLLLRFFRETLNKHALEHLEAAGPERNGSFFFLQ